MKFREIVALLENETRLPIKPNRIAQLLKEGGVVEQVFFIGVELDTTILQGKFVRLQYEERALKALPRPYADAETNLIIKVYYAKCLPRDERRLVVNKELLHAIDPDFVRTATETEALALVQKLKLPRELWVGQKAPTDSARGHLSALIDYMSDYRAVVAMLPQQIRDLLCKQHAAGKISEDEIARLTGIPRKYIAFIIDDLWVEFKAIWCDRID